MQQTSETKQFKTYEAGKVQEVLSNLGYPIQDYGDYIRTRAIYRNGDAANTLKVWKDSGWCVDYAEDKKGFSLYDLVAKTIGTKNPQSILPIINAERKAEITIACPKYQMAKTFDKSCLERLLPNYSFYEKRGISSAVQKMYRLGYATKDQMFQRMTFPVFNEHGQIVGFSGRHIYWDENSNAPKWKHIGRKDQWIYPYYTAPKCKELVDSAEEIVLVESIGDSLALSQNEIFNHLVTFGLDCSTALLAFLLQKDPKIITISTNDDSEKEENRGKIAAIKTLLKLSTVFPVDMLRIKLPTRNDISDMHQHGDNISSWQQSGETLSKNEILATINKHREKFQADKLGKFLKKYE